MKTILIGLMAGTVMFGFRESKTSENLESEICGTWQGAYGSLKKVEKLVITLKPDNTIEFYEGEEPKNKITGTYLLKGDTAIVITCKGQEMVSQVNMYGTVNKTKNFVDGTWESEGSSMGSFYLQKQSFQL